MHFLQKKIELLAEFTGVIQELCELLEVAVETIQFLSDVASFRQERDVTGLNKSSGSERESLIRRAGHADEEVRRSRS